MRDHTADQRRAHAVNDALDSAHGRGYHASFHDTGEVWHLSAGPGGETFVLITYADGEQRAMVIDEPFDALSQDAASMLIILWRRMLTRRVQVTR